ncbi:protocadherin-11 X-linked-like isoform X2 [Haliotis rubra]|uniref:protocadherin-11 X-linked-like isoform X2 n=1 Tax=Haliotis rubra TaxID=36100 RepID=UPI001EE5A83F|nr:protocadherin-11 X-linked-like isoform X2 [Haliotis rubra]
MLCVTALCIVVCAVVGGEAQGDVLNYTVEEEQPPGTFVGNVAKDSNVSSAIAGEDLASVRYRILRPGETPNFYFLIDNRSGVLSTASVLDRENITICEFKRICKFSIYIALQSGPFFRTILVNILLEDINDEIPEFPHPAIKLEILESVSVGSSYTIDSAEDSDGGENHSVQAYAIFPSNGTFALSVTKNVAGRDVLRIVVNSPLDSETRDFYQLRVQARDGGRPPNVGELLVNISISDENDNPPVFSHDDYHANISEALPNTSTILTVHATDRDSGHNGKVFYMLSPQQSAINRELFKINRLTGEITPRKPLSSQQGKTVRLVVQAYDGGSDPFVTPSIVFINVLDTVNNPPYIQLNILNGVTSAEVMEHSSLGFAVAHMVVSDEDSGTNGQVNCSVMSDRFQLQSLKVNEYKVVVSGVLDRETSPQYNLTILCQDGGRPALRTTASFTVDLVDINDYPPTFKQQHYVANITENNAIGKVITKVKAVDRDAGDNSRITYVITSAYPRITNFININSDSGVVTAVDKLDREVFDRLNITVIAFDHGDPPMSSNVSLTIFILDENDNEPEFREAVYLFKILENKPIDTHVGQIRAYDTDLDGGGFVTYSIVDIGQYVPFILTSTGILLSNDVFDREQRDEYSFDVEASDHGYPSLANRVRVIVEITDVNDNTPVITFPNEVNMTSKIPFQDPPGTQIAAVKGEDRDSGLNAHLQFSMRHDSPQKSFLFSIDGSSGIIFVNKHLREENVGTYVVFVSATDEGTPPRSSGERILEITVFVGNSTALMSGVSPGQNALIVITLLCLTVIIAAIVLTVLLRIRRRDRQKKSDSDVTLEDLPRTSGPDYPTERDGGFSSYKAVQVEDEDVTNSSSNTLPKDINKHELLLFKMQLAEQYKQREQENLEEVESSSKLDQHPVQESHVISEKYDVTDQQMTRLAALKYQQALIRGSKKGLSQHHSPRYGPKGETITDDILSNSSGETTGTDSGRGYSEEDSHSQGRSSLPSETDDSGFPIVRFDCIRDQKKTSIIPQNRQRNSIPLVRQGDVSMLPPALKSDHRQRTLDSVTLKNNSSRKKPYSVHFDQDSQSDFQTHVPRYLGTFAPQPRPRSRNSDANLTFKKGLTGYSLDNLNDSVDDDNTTTTSGSYTIDHDDPPDEMITFSGFGLKDVYV